MKDKAELELPGFHVDGLVPSSIEEDGSILADVLGHYQRDGVDSEEKRFNIAEQTGVLPEQVYLTPDELPSSRGSRDAGRLSVGFAGSPWKTPWIPEGDKDKLVLN
jgi:hypothetical protein